MDTVSRETKQEVVRALADRYKSADRAVKIRILDEFVALTGYHRKHAIRVLNGENQAPLRPQDEPKVRSRVYDEAVREALVVLWEASDRVCGKRLKSILPVLVSALERHGHLDFDGSVREKLLNVSASTINRLLAPTRMEASNTRPPRKPPAVRTTASFYGWMIQPI